MAAGILLGVGVGAVIGSKLNLGANVNATNLAEKAQDGIKDVSEAAQNKTGTGLLSNVKGIFKSKDIKPQKTKAAAQPESTPKTIKRQVLKPLKSLSYFPAQMKYFVMFRIYDKVSETVLSNFKEKDINHIYLPMPTNLVDEMKATYDSVALGPALGVASRSINEIRATAGQAIEEGQNVFDAVTSGITLAGVVRNTVDVAAGEALMGQAGVQSFVKNVLRQAPNPFLATVFSNIDLRSHQFTYKFAPKSEQELKKLKDICFEFRKALLPARSGGGFADSGILLKFPYEIEIEFYPTPNKPYSFKRCVLTDVQFNYAPEGSPAFFKTGDPVAVSLSLSFRELEAFVREDIEDIQKKLNTEENPQTFESPTEVPAGNGSVITPNNILL